MRSLLVGDVHAVPEELDDCERLLQGVRETAAGKKAAEIVFMGDLFHTHSVVRVEVLNFWYRHLFRLRQDFSIVILKGNHDEGKNGKDHVLEVFKAIDDGPNFTVVDEPIVDWGRLLMPYRHNSDEFVRDCHLFADTSTVLCHQTFDGAKYENGFYAPGGVLPGSIDQEAVISGHIHTPQAFDKVLYVGAPRWRTIADAGVDRHLVLVDFERNGVPKDISYIPTDQWCRRIHHLVDTEGQKLPVWNAVKGADLRVDVRGSGDYITKGREHWESLAAQFDYRLRLRTFRTDLSRPATVRESDGVAVAFRRFLDGWTPPGGTDRTTLFGMAQQRLGSMVG